MSDATEKSRVIPFAPEGMLVLPIAARVLEKLGGPVQVAGWLGLSVPTVYRWTYPRGRRGKHKGTGGLVPAIYQQILLEYARLHQLPLTPEDFFLLPEEGTILELALAETAIAQDCENIDPERLTA